MNKKVLLTGVTGFLGSHTTIRLLNRGYKVLGTLRDAKRSDEIKRVIAGHTEHVNNLSFVEASLEDISIWEELTKDIDYVQHIASPFPRELPKNDQKLIRPAKEGTLTILEAALKNQVTRVVVTSSIGAIVYGKEAGKENGVYTETHWTDENNIRDTTPYFRSKTIAEKAAWDFQIAHKDQFELATVCPGAILGPILEKDFGTSANIVIKLLDGSTPALPNLGFDIVDVRSVADLLILAMEKPEAKGERFIATNGHLRFKEIADLLRQEYSQKKIPSMKLPNFAVRLLSNFDKTLKPILLDLGKHRVTESIKAKKVLGWNPISAEEAVKACAKSVMEMGIVE